MYEQAVLAVEDPTRFAVVHQAIETSFSSGSIGRFLKSVEHARLRIRDFETVLRKKMLGDLALVEYSQLGNSDKGQIREFYLASLERVDPELRRKYFRLYAYY